MYCVHPTIFMSTLIRVQAVVDTRNFTTFSRRYDAAEYVIDLMPTGLKTQGKLLKSEIKAEGRLNELMYVAKKCRELVFEEHRGAPAQAKLYT